MNTCRPAMTQTREDERLSSNRIQHVQNARYLTGKCQSNELLSVRLFIVKSSRTATQVRTARLGL